jgi:hypothetical protein
LNFYYFEYKSPVTPISNKSARRPPVAYGKNNSHSQLSFLHLCNTGTVAQFTKQRLGQSTVCMPIGSGRSGRGRERALGSALPVPPEIRFRARALPRRRAGRRGSGRDRSIDPVEGLRQGGGAGKAGSRAPSLPASCYRPGADAGSRTEERGDGTRSPAKRVPPPRGGGGESPAPAAGTLPRPRARNPVAGGFLRSHQGREDHRETAR